MRLQQPLVELQAAARQVATAYQVLAVVQASMKGPRMAVGVTAWVVASVRAEVKRQPGLGLAVVAVSGQQLEEVVLACSGVEVEY